MVFNELYRFEKLDLRTIKVKKDLREGDTIKLKKNLKIGKRCGGLSLFEAMVYTDELTVMIVIDKTAYLKGCDGYEWWYSFAMLDFRTIRRKKDKD